MSICCVVNTIITKKARHEIYFFKFFFQIQGLCGNYDLNINNEFLSRTGLLVSKTKFAQEFLASTCFTDQRDDIETEPCSININVSHLVF